MGLRDELPVTPQRVRCHVQMLYQALGRELAVELEELVNDPSISTIQLMKLCRLKQWPVAPSDSSFKRHRKGDCQCL